MNTIRHAVLWTVLAAAWPATGADWSTFHGDASLSGCVETRLPANPVRLWRFNAGAPVTQTPVAAGDTIIVLTDASELIALDLRGARKWSARIPSGKELGGKPGYRVFPAPPAIVEGVVLLGSADGILHAFDMQTGAVQWTNSAGSGVGGSAVGFPAGDGHADFWWRAAVLSQPDGVLHAFDLATGKRAWSSAPTDRCDGSPSSAGGQVVFGSCASALHVIDVADGHLVRTVGLGTDRQVAGGVALAGEQAFAGTRGGGLVAVDLRAGNILWTNRELTGELFTTPAVCADRVVMAADDGTVRSLRRVDGRTEWTADIGAGPATSPAIAGDKVIAAGGGNLVLLDRSTGKRLWSAAVSDATSGPAIVGRMIVIGGDDGMVSAYGEEKP